ncbi:hypothetical protein [Sulfurirhabdus autotrophica]|uniref:hypothetical protein n=1 Tax=Sulfurirhabdus autotrophica TaxID=1706046 RepID=UPI000F6135C4|nr:hypothetical protein [Sulfurirhabdus autotrophica]
MSLSNTWWLEWDFCVQTVGWAVGWCACRTLTLGRFPAEKITQVDDDAPFQAFIVEIIGLALIALTIYQLSESWPRM